MVDVLSGKSVPSIKRNEVRCRGMIITASVHGVTCLYILDRCSWDERLRRTIPTVMVGDGRQRQFACEIKPERNSRCNTVHQSGRVWSTVTNHEGDKQKHIGSV